jgi:methylamine--corrinoid protein Co-methyltransferase
MLVREIMLDFFEIYDRTKNGEKMDEKKYEMKIYNKISELVKEAGINYDPGSFIPCDKKLADTVFESGLDLAVEVGAYCLDTKRIIKFTEEEIKDRLKKIPAQINIGEGREQKKVIARKPGDLNMPVIIGGGTGPFEEKLQVPFYQSIASLPINAIDSCNMNSSAGRRIIDPPLLVWATKKIVEWAREGISRAGKPGLHVFSYPLLPRSDVLLAVLSPKHIRTTDCISASPVPELYKLQYDAFTAAHMAHDYGCFVNEGNIGMIGGYAGTPEGAAIECVGSRILGEMINKPDYALCYLVNSFDVDAGLNAPEKRWAETLMLQAITGNTNMKIKMTVTSAAEPGTEQALLERVIPLLHCRSRGCSLVLFTGRPARPKRLNLGSPMEIQWSLDVLKMVYELNINEINEILKKLYVLLPPEKLKNPPRGLSLDEGYDSNYQPKKNYLDIYEQALKKIEELGIKIDAQ